MNCLSGVLSRIKFMLGLSGKKKMYVLKYLHCQEIQTQQVSFSKVRLRKQLKKHYEAVAQSCNQQAAMHDNPTHTCTFLKDCAKVQISSEETGKSHVWQIEELVMIDYYPDSNKDRESQEQTIEEVQSSISQSVDELMKCLEIANKTIEEMKTANEELNKAAPEAQKEKSLEEAPKTMELGDALEQCA